MSLPRERQNAGAKGGNRRKWRLGRMCRLHGKRALGLLDLLVLAGAALEGVLAETPEQLVGTGAAEQPVPAEPAAEPVVALLAEQHVLTALPVDHVITAVTADHVGLVAPLDHVVAAKPDDHVGGG